MATRYTNATLSRKRVTEVVNKCKKQVDKRL